MGTISKGILGGFSGKVGHVVGASWKGIDYMRSKSGKRSGPPTASQLIQQEKFGLMTKFLRVFAALVTVTFKSFAKGQTGINAAVSYNLQNAVSGTQSPFSVDYSKVLLSRGDLPLAPSCIAMPLAGNKVKFTWENNAGSGIAKDTDKSIPIVWGGEFNEAVFSLTDGASRSVMEMVLDCSSMNDTAVHTWLAFMSEDGKKLSSSVYTGTFNLLP